MIGLILVTAAQVTQPLAMPNDFRGRWACSVATRRAEPSKFELWIDKGKASTLGNEAAGFSPVRDAAVVHHDRITEGDMSIEPMEFRTDGATVLVKSYTRERFYHWLYLTVVHDADSKHALARETAAGFCIPVLPSPRGSK